MLFFTRSQAFIVGVGRYAHFADLLDTATDALAMAEILNDSRYGGYSHSRVEVLPGPTVSRDEILSGLRTLATSASDEGTTVFYFSGHGGYISSDPGTVYLCGSEADPEDLPGTAISNSMLSTALAEIHTQRLLVILDVCHAAGAVTLKSPPPTVAWQEGPPGHYFREIGASSGHIILASSRRDQASQMYPPGHMSLFTYYLIEGLKGRANPGADGTIHVFELFDYVSGAMRRISSNQTPILAAKDVDTNFPIVALRHLDNQHRVTPLNSPSAISEIHEQIVEKPRVGAKALVVLLRTLPYELLEQADIDLAIVETNSGEIARLEDRMRAFGETPELRVARLGSIDYLIETCLKWERFERRQIERKLE